MILNGPGLADLNGGDAFRQIEAESSALCAELGFDLELRQSDKPDELVRWITADNRQFDALIINPSASLEAGTVESGALHAAIASMAGTNKPVIEVRLNNIFRPSIEQAKPLQGPEGQMGFICGLGLNGYLLGIRAVAERLGS